MLAVNHQAELGVVPPRALSQCVVMLARCVGFAPVGWFTRHEASVAVIDHVRHGATQ